MKSRRNIPRCSTRSLPELSSLPLRYLCKLSDQELRQSAARNMADLMWSTVKEPLDSALCFDKESLDLAFKYFMSPTLTMRLAGLSQITVSLHSHHNLTSFSVDLMVFKKSVSLLLFFWLSFFLHLLHAIFLYNK